MRKIVFNSEKALDRLFDDMTTAEQERYENFWDDMDPWRKAMNWSTRTVLVLLVVGLFLNNSIIVALGMILAIPLFIAGMIVFILIQNGCAKIAYDVLARLDRI